MDIAIINGVFFTIYIARQLGSGIIDTASEQLSGQASLLKEMIDEFTLINAD